MKLKKIASLMLAGIMAVSMLTACQGTNVDPEDPTNPVEPGTDGVSAEIGDMVEHPDYVVFKDSDALNNNLKDAVEYAGVLDVMPDYITADRLTTIAPDVAAELDELVGVTFLRNGITPVTLWNIGDAYVLLDAEREDSLRTAIRFLTPLQSRCMLSPVPSARRLSRTRLLTLSRPCLSISTASTAPTALVLPRTAATSTTPTPFLSAPALRLSIAASLVPALLVPASSVALRIPK